MPRKITIDDWKNKRDLSAWKIELNGYDMTDTNAKYDTAVRVLAEREAKRIDTLKDTLWNAAVQFFGINITPEKLEEDFLKIMNDDRNKGAVISLRRREEERVRQLEAEEAKRVAALKASHKKLIADLEKSKVKNEKKTEDLPASDSGSITDETAYNEPMTEEPKA